jgi:hypothetical protein
MKKPRSSGRHQGAAALVVVGLCLAAPAAARAQAAECPNPPPESVKERRSVAKEWFSRAETFEATGDDVAAVNAYSCSFEMVPHPSTAYNLARAAERANDLPLAITANRDYLTLKPDAPDRTEIEARIISLEGRLVAGTASPPTTAPPRPPPPPARAASLTARESPPPRFSLADRMSIPEWIIAGVGTASLVAGVVFNVGARVQMSDCRELARGGDIVGARAACDRAVPLAYTSYVLLGAAAAATIADVVLIWTNRARHTSMTVVPLPGGGALAAGGRF